MIYGLSRDKEEGPSFRSISLSSLEDAGWTEKHLEDALAERIDLVVREDQLLVLAQERPRQEEADILALDEKGTLYIFELKRWQSDQSNLLQVMRYGQMFGQYSYQRLQDRFRKYVKDSSADLAAYHQRHFELEEPLARGQFNTDQEFVVVTAGIDLDTLAAIRYWRRKGLRITALTYHVYEDQRRFYVEFHSFAPEPDEGVGLLSNHFIVNTDITYQPEGYKAMLAESKASAYHNRKNAVDKIEKGDRVFLYHNRVGVVAVGRALGKARECDWQGDEGAEHYVRLQFKLKADPILEPEKCVSAAEINEAMHSGHCFRQTAFSITGEMGDKIEELLRAKHEAHETG